MRPFFLLLLLILLLLSACKINYDLAGGEDDDSIPDIYMKGLKEIQTSGGETSFVITADEASIFSEEGETFFENLEFRETDAKGDVLLLGTMGKARSYNKNDADLTDGVRIESFRDEVMVEGEAFFWKDGLQKLTAPRNSKVTMVREGDTEISGTGFEADFKLNEISFNQSVEGVLHFED
ncbi:MAG: LPS export ABC transporter periplasmic protein LptC [Spirochaetales bacterium]|nr:LPS export ABC transporter periplasmic protein LptC [Spirochaetales bacterium]